MKNFYLLFIFSPFLLSQVNFSEHISPIIYNECTICHRDGGAGPMPFTSYSEVASLGAMVEYVTSIGYMPPWHADPDYSHFLGERVLSQEEKQLISDWVSGGMQQGDPSLEAPLPVFSEGSVINDTPDAEFIMEEPYLIEGNLQDDYRVFVFETNFDEPKSLKCIEFIPGNPEVVHHVLINIDDGQCAALDANTPEYGYECESGFCTGSIPFLATGYIPGGVPPVWNNDVGLTLEVGQYISIQVHYAPNSIDQYDQSKINLFFKDEPVQREVKVETIVDTQLYIPANEVYEHYRSFDVSEIDGVGDNDISLLSILPHMHLIGKSWLVYAENNGDTIPLINIPDWDFNW